ncbi:MAG: hypothetical protein ATN31_02630 [Candidatus Epulonipiscioides saccharophilum]|nr:MAG: hypothetical protein ATN31_02630 [Epulopiscium sp. AS2M-Bin001]
MKKTALEKAINAKTKKIKTESFDLSFNEILDMYNNKELIIAPDYQRMFRWSVEKQSMLIESLILDMPLPPIFVIETEDGIYELIDGLQRISTYLHFRYDDIGCELKKELCNNIEEALELDGCDIIEELNGNTFSKLSDRYQRALKRHFIRIEVLKSETDREIRYHMFKRLNTGGELLSDQEVRDCTIRILGDKFNNFIKQCSKDENFINSIYPVQEEYAKTKKDQELVLRYFALRNNLKNYNKNLNGFLTGYMEEVTKDDGCFNYDKEEDIFKSVFKYINEMYGINAFSSLINEDKNKYRKDMVMYVFDSLTCGLAKHIDEIDKKDKIKLKKELTELRRTKFANKTGGGKGNTKERIEMVEKVIKECPLIDRTE